MIHECRREAVETEAIQARLRLRLEVKWDSLDLSPDLKLSRNSLPGKRIGRCSRYS
jgi:hypothetical protein